MTHAIHNCFLLYRWYQLYCLKPVNIHIRFEQSILERRISRNHSLTIVYDCDPCLLNTNPSFCAFHDLAIEIWTFLSVYINCTLYIIPSTWNRNEAGLGSKQHSQASFVIPKFYLPEVLCRAFYCPARTSPFLDIRTKWYTETGY